MNTKITNTCSFSKLVLVDNIAEFCKASRGQALSPKYADETIVCGSNLETFGIGTCIGGGASNPIQSKGSLFHYCMPEEQELSDIYNNVKALETSDVKPKILIVGGLHPWELSEYYYFRVMERLSEFKENISILWGQKDFSNSNINLHFGAKDDTWTIYPQGFDGKKFKKDPLQYLKSIYHTAKIADGQELFFKGEKINLHV